jgi:hypothetical protein
VAVTKREGRLPNLWKIAKLGSFFTTFATSVVKWGEKTIPLHHFSQLFKINRLVKTIIYTYQFAAR